MEKEISDSDYRELINSELSTLSHYLAGFALPNAPGEPLDAQLGGSGTLVTIDSVCGILTADHVLSLLRSRQSIGLILPSPVHRDLHNFTFDVAESSSFSLPDRGDPQSGPDLALLIPPPHVLETLRARKSFYNLSKRREMMLTGAPPLGHGIWVLSGLASEWTRDTAPERGFSMVKVFRGGLSGGTVPIEHTSANFDYLVFPALYNELYEGPDSFGGFSGGSLWQLLVKYDGYSWEVTDRLLSGVAFYQSAKQSRSEGTVRDIICHGRKSIYGNLIDEVRSKAQK